MRDIETSETLKIEQAEVRLQKFLREFERALHSVYRKVLTGLERGDVAASDAAKLLGDLSTQINKLVLAPELAKLDPIYARELANVKKYFEAFGYKNVLTGADAKFAETLITFDVSAVKTRVLAGTDALKSAVMRSVISGGKPDLTDLIDSRTAGIVGNVETELRTGLSGFQQSLINNKAGEVGLDLFIYLGPDDDITRPFCKDVLDANKVWTEEQINALDNEQGLDAFTYGGGYNCRHQWRPVSAEWAEENGYTVENEA